MDNRDRESRPYRSPRTTPEWVDALAVRAARFPWWTLIIAAGLVVLFYSFATSNLYRRVLLFVTDNPQVSTNRYARVGYLVQSDDGREQTVRGTLIAQDDTTVTLELTREERTTILKSDIGKLTCAEQASNGECPVGQPVSVERVSVTGHLILEDLGRYQIVSDAGDTLNILKISTTSEVREPEKCSADPEGNCIVHLTLAPGKQGNTFENVLLLEATVDSITVQTVPPQVTVIPREKIIRQLDYTPEQCALNNLAGCNEGPFLTLGVTFGAFALAVVIGLTFGLMRISNNPILTNLATVYVEVIRGVPLLVILLFVNFAFAPWFRDEFPNYAPRVALIVGILGALLALIIVVRSLQQRAPLSEAVRPVMLAALLTVVLIVVVFYFGANSNLDALQRAILGLAFGYGAFLAELFRAGIQSIGRGQMEAARSLGMTYVQAMRYIVLPQAFRVVLPPLGNEFIAILKDTSLIAVIAVPELTQKARLFASATYQVFPSYITIGALYLVMTLFLSFLVRTAERRTQIYR
ncbi:MAG: amino acid ABC transporter permease [Anaerolineae bacterium]